jgi:hypothetical protein
MARISIANSLAGIRNAVGAGGQLRAKDQLSAVVDALRQLVGNANIVAGNTESADPLNGPFTLYVNPYRGSDRFVGGQYNTHEAGTTDTEIIAQKLRRISLQQLECGYTKQRPFKTINRAVIEAAIITSRNWYTYNDERAHVDCVVIVLSAGRHIIYNGPGSASSNLASWGSSKDPTIQELQDFNPVNGGVLAPRGASVIGKVLRKTIIRPDWVPPFDDELADYSNRRQILLHTGSADAFQFTVMDRLGQTESCHLLSAMGAASRAELDLFYDKIESALGTGADLASALLAARPTEYQTPGPIDQSQAATPAWNSTAGASPYPFQVSVRSDWGMGSVFWDGAKMAGLKSMVRANFTNTNQQKDLRCFQVYESGNWVTLTNDNTGQTKYYNATPDNIRRHPGRHSYGLLAVRDAYLQDVSIFGIGLSRRTKIDSGADVTDNNGNTTFGELSAEAAGYKSFAFPVDKNWTVGRIKVPLNLSEKIGNIRRIDLGVVASATSSTITLTGSGLAIDASSSTIPAVLLGNGYSLANGTKVWVENPQGNDWRATLTSSAWSDAAPTVINITGELQEAVTNTAGGTDVVGRRVYIRRLADTRSVSERRLSLLLNNTSSSRLPQRDQVLQTDPARSGGAISRVLAAGGDEVLVISAAGDGPTPGSGVLRTSELTIRRAAPNRAYVASTSTFYRKGTVVRHAGKHWQAKQDMTTAAASPDPALWLESHVQMASDFNPEDPLVNEAPLLVLDTDTADTEDSVTLGIDWTTVWTAAGSIRNQYRTGTDYLGVYGFLRALGFNDAQAHAALVPKVTGSRERDPNSATDFPDAPAGGAATARGYWAVEFRRPSTLRFYNHNWEWAGFGNYDRALPSVQGDISPANKFSAYFVNNAGGRVVPKGSNEDGFEVSPKGLEDIATGATISAEGLGNQSLDEIQRTDFPNGIQVGGDSTIGNVTISGTVDFGNGALAKTNIAGVVKLASANQLKAQSGTSLYAVASDSSIDQTEPEVVTYPGLNLWRQSQRLISAATGAITIYVNPLALDRKLEEEFNGQPSMFDSPPITPATAIPSLARASEYANAVIGGGNQTARIAMAPGLYDPASIWNCNVEFWACDPSLPAETLQDRPVWRMPFREVTAGSDTDENDFFDGSGYGNFTTRVNFLTFRLVLRDAATAGNNLHVNASARQLRCRRSVDFRGGFHFLGVPHLIKAVADNAITPSQLLTSSVTLPTGSFDADVTSNVNTLLNALRINNGRNASYGSWTLSAPIRLEGSTTDVANLRSIMLGPALPSHKESLGGARPPYIETNGLVALRFSNIYLRGNTTITSAGMGVTNNVPESNAAHYGSSVVAAPWTWRQFHHTFLGGIGDGPVSIDLMGGQLFYTETSSTTTRIWFKNNTKFLPNHIHLLDATGAEPANDNDGPFLDQFIHAKRSLFVRDSFSSSNAQDSTRDTSEGFVGKFGSNGYNSVKVRGVLLGNDGILDQERGAAVFLALGNRLSANVVDNTALTIFKVAGRTIAQTNQILPRYVPGSATFGEPNPVGAVDRKYNPVITAAAIDQRTSPDGTFALNMALRSYVRGISPEHGFNITPNVVL